LRIFS